MSFDAYKRMRDLIATAMTDDFPAHLEAVNTLHGTAAKPLRAVYRHTHVPPSMYPCAVVTQPRGSITDDHTVISALGCTVVVCATGANPDEVDANIETYITATARTFAGATLSGVEFFVTAVDADQPAPFDKGGDMAQFGFVEVTATFAE